MYRLLILICLNETPLELCREDTAISVTRPIDIFPTQMGCAIASMQALPFLQADGSTHSLIKCEVAHVDEDFPPHSASHLLGEQEHPDDEHAGP